MKRKAVAALMLGVALAATGCGQTEKKETEAPVTEAVTEAAEEETTEAATEEETTEAAEEETTEAATEEETTEAAEEETTEAVTEEETTEAATEAEVAEAAEEATEEETTEAAEEETTEAVTEEETTEAAEEETTEAVTEEEAAEEETTEAVTEEEAAEEETTEAVTEEETTEAAEEETTEAVTEEETTEAAEEETTEAVTEEETTEAAEEETTEAAEEESETEVDIVALLAEMPEYKALDYVTLGEYKGLTIEQQPVEISEEDVQAMIEWQTAQTLTEGTVEDGDTVTIDYDGTVDGEAFDGGSTDGQGTSLEIGSNTYIDGFESGLIGVEIGSETELNLTFPEDYHAEELAGKDVVFKVTVHSATRYPELTDEIAAEVADGMTAEEYTQSVRDDLAESAALEQENAAKSEILQKVFENAEVAGYPMETFEFYMKVNKASMQQVVELYYGMTIEEYYESQGMDEEQFMSEMETQIKQSLSQELVIKAVAEQEGLEVTEDEYNTFVAEQAEQAEMSEEEVVAAMGGENYVKFDLLMTKAIEFLYENANIVELDAEEATEAAEEVTEAAEDAEEETTEAVTEEETTEAATEEETTEAVTEEEITEAVTEEEITEAAEEETTEAETAAEETETDAETEA